MKLNFSALSAVTLCTLTAFGTAHALDITFTNSSGLPDSEVYIWLQQDVTGTFKGTGNPVEKNKSYSLATIGSQGLDISSWAGGRLFASYGAPFPGMTSDGSAPQFINPPNAFPKLSTAPGAPTPINNSFNNRHQLIAELTTGGNGNLSNIDWVAIPARLTTSTGGVEQQSRGFSSGFSAAQSYAYGNALSGLTSGFANLNAISNAAGNDPTSSPQTGSGSVQPASPGSGNPVRVVGPTQQSFFTSTNASENYRSFDAYVSAIRAANPNPSASSPVARLAGKFFAGSTPTYDAKVTQFDAPADPTTSLGSAVIEGMLSSGESFTITIAESSFTNDNVYSASSSFEFDVSVDGAPATTQNLGTNNAYTLPVRDFVAGLNYGFINSPITNPNDPTPNTTYGDSESQYWGSLNLITLDPQTLLAFDQVQPHNPYYNQWAQTVYQTTGGEVYGFPYDDVFNTNQVDLNVDVLNIELFPSIYAIPEPSVIALVGLSGVAFAFSRWRKRKSQ